MADFLKAKAPPQAAADVIGIRTRTKHLLLFAVTYGKDYSAVVEVTTPIRLLIISAILSASFSRPALL